MSTLDYLLFLPKGYDAKATKRWPLILFLHGAGERGTDVWKVATHGPPKNVADAPGLPVYRRLAPVPGRPGLVEGRCCWRCWMISRRPMRWTQTGFTSPG